MIQRRSMEASYCATEPEDTRPTALTAHERRATLLRLAARLTPRRGELHRKRLPRPARPRLAPDHVQDRREHEDQKPPRGLQHVPVAGPITYMEIPKPEKVTDTATVRPDLGLGFRLNLAHPPVNLSVSDSPRHIDSSPLRFARDKSGVMTILNQQRLRPASSPRAEAEQNRHHEEATDDPTSNHGGILLRHRTGRHPPPPPPRPTNHGPRPTAQAVTM